MTALFLDRSLRKKKQSKSRVTRATAHCAKKFINAIETIEQQQLHKEGNNKMFPTSSESVTLMDRIEPGNVFINGNNGCNDLRIAIFLSV